VNELQSQGYKNVTVEGHAFLDLINMREVSHFFDAGHFDAVFVCAGKVGGIGANAAYPADFLYENAMIACNVIHSAAKSGVGKLVYLGSSCIYPKSCAQPIRPEYLMTGELEPTNEAYATAKILGIKLCQAYSRQYGKNFVSVMPCNLYGIYDNFDPENGHVIPAMLRKFHQAKVSNADHVTIWGSGGVLREFMHASDCAKGLIIAMEKYDDASQPFNLGSGFEWPISSLAFLMKLVTGFKGDIEFDCNRPDGTYRKLLDSGVASSLGFDPQIGLEQGLRGVYAWAIKEGKLN
jgi:GDP-L-fucose synthase